MDIIPVETGSYAVILRLAFPQTVVIGRLGSYHLAEGYYLYTGSAYGSGGLRARLGRHLQGGGQAHWHIDYIREIARVSGWGTLVATASPSETIPLECQWSQWLTNATGTSIPIPGFGASDCRSGCRAHLIHCTQAHIWQDFAMHAGLTTWRWLGRDGGS